MKTLLLAAAALALCAGAAQSAPKVHANVLVGPDQPIPYARLSAYSKASAKARATNDWWSGSAFAQTGASADTSARSAAGTPIDSPTPAAANPGVSSSQPAGVASSATAPPSASSASAPSRR